MKEVKLTKEIFKNSKKTIKIKCDALWSEIVRSKGYCKVCGRTGLLIYRIEFGYL